MAWLNAPLPVLGAMARQMDSIVAEEALRAIQGGLVASATMKPHEARRVIRDLQKSASAGRPKVVASPERLAAAGINVRKAKRRKEPPE